MMEQYDGIYSLLFMNTNLKPKMSNNYTSILHDVPIANFKLETERQGEYRRLWILVMQFLMPYDIINLRNVSKLVYLATFEQEVWRSVMTNYYLNRSGVIETFDMKLLFSVRNSMMVIEKLRYSFWQSDNELCHDMFSINKHEFRMCEGLSLSQLIEIQGNDRDICYAIMKLNCIGCREYMEEMLYYKSLKAYLCENCSKIQKYRLVTECEACFENGISASQLHTLNLDDEEGRYFDVLIKARLDMLKKKLPIPPRGMLEDEARNKLPDKQPKHLNNRRLKYPKDIRGSKYPASKQYKKVR